MAARPHHVLSGILFCCVFTLTSPARAEEKISRLTTENITAFIYKTTELTSGRAQDLTSEEITEYLEKHLDKKARFKSTMRYVVPGFPPEENSMSLDKKDFIASVSKGAETVSDYENAIEIGNIEISSDGTKATVETTSMETGTMPISVDGINANNVPVEGTSACTQILMLQKGVIQMYNANCVTEINFLE